MEGREFVKVKRVNRYYCDFCKKSGCGKHAMWIHENHCTMNPNRVCRMCKSPRDIPDLVLTVPRYVGQSGIPTEGQTAPDYSPTLAVIRKLCDDCPACILSVFRQAKVPIYYSHFDFKEECKAWFEEKHESERQAEEWSATHA